MHAQGADTYGSSPDNSPIVMADNTTPEHALSPNPPMLSPEPTPVRASAPPLEPELYYHTPSEASPPQGSAMGSQYGTPYGSAQSGVPPPTSPFEDRL